MSCLLQSRNKCKRWPASLDSSRWDLISGPAEQALALGENKSFSPPVLDRTTEMYNAAARFFFFLPASTPASERGEKRERAKERARSE